MSPVLELRDVAKRFGAVDAVRSVDLSIEAGELITLLGPSGAGKTTLLRIIAGLEAPDAGRILVDGEDVTHRPPDARNIGMVFQDFLLFPHRTVAENVAFPLRMQGHSQAEREQRLAWVLDLVRLTALAERHPHQLSAGEKQRVALARGLVARPSVLLLDEPLARLDREVRGEMEVEIRRHQQDLAIPFLYVTHHHEEALTLSDRIAVLHDGRIEQLGPTMDVYHAPQTRFVAAFVGAPNRMRGRVVAQNAHYARVHWGSLDLICPAIPGAVDGDLVDIYLKPERIRITTEDGAFGEEVLNQLEGRLRDVIFKGAYLDCQVQLDGGREFVVSAPPDTPGLDRGASVRLAWMAEASAGFPAEGE